MESWNRKRKLQNSRPSRSYLVRQPGFEFLELNKKGSIIPVILLKNGNHLLNRPISVPEQGKLMISNTCSVDSILSILATTAADSSSYRKYFTNLRETNLTASIVLQIITEKKMKQIYYNRALLLFKFFSNKLQTLVGGHKSIDTTDTAGSMVNKIMGEMPSFIKTSNCTNNFCSVPGLEVTSTQLSLNVYDGQINILRDLLAHIESSEENCDFCGNKRSVTVAATTHIMIELNSIPSGKYY